MQTEDSMEYEKLEQMDKQNSHIYRSPNLIHTFKKSIRAKRIGKYAYSTSPVIVSSDSFCSVIYRLYTSLLWVTMTIETSLTTRSAQKNAQIHPSHCVLGTNNWVGTFFSPLKCICGGGTLKEKKKQLCMGAAICWGHSVDRPALCGFVYEHQDETSTLVYI